MKLFSLSIIAALLLCSGCGRFPRDSAGTLEHVTGGELRVGVTDVGGQEARLTAFLRELSARTGSTVRPSTGPGESLLIKLEDGELDLVVGVFDKKPPWARRVTFSQPMARVEGSPVEELKAATRNGEHAWAMEVDRAVAALPGAVQ